MRDTERRTHPSLRETLTFTKELPLSWLFTFLIGGTANFAALVWMAATIVSNINSHDKAILDLRVQTTANTTLIAAQTVLIQAQQVMISENKEGLRTLSDRFNLVSDRPFNR